MDKDINGIKIERKDRQVHDPDEMNRLFISIIAQADNQTKNVHYKEIIENQNIIQGQGTLSRSYLSNLGIGNTWLFTPGLPPSKYKETR